MVWSSVTGHPPSPFVARRPSPRRPPLPGSRPAPALGRPLRVARVIRETADVVSLVLEEPSGAPIAFEPGQFFTLLVNAAGEVLRRAYSASSAPGEHGGGVRVTIKRVRGGKASNHLVDHAREGEILTVLGPSGSFVPSPSEVPRHLVLLAGGSGITPMLGILRTLLVREPWTRISLVYGNRGVQDIAFRQELDELVRFASSPPGRLRVRHVLEEPGEEFESGQGLLTREVMAAELEALGPGNEDDYYVCGPEPMMVAAREALLARGVPGARIHEEKFSQPHLREATQTPQIPVAVTFRGASGETRLVQAPGQTLLEAGLASGIALPYSCTVGGCGACKVRVVRGEVIASEPNALSEDERREGFVLSCVGHARTPTEIEIP